MVAAACSDDSEGERGDGGLLRNTSAPDIEMRRGREVCGELDAEGGSEFRSGGIVVGCATPAFVVDRKKEEGCTT
jgi:hypothetical protein